MDTDNCARCVPMFVSLSKDLKMWKSRYIHVLTASTQCHKCPCSSGFLLGREQLTDGRGFGRGALRRPQARGSQEAQVLGATSQPGTFAPAFAEPLHWDHTLAESSLVNSVRIGLSATRLAQVCLAPPQLTPSHARAAGGGGRGSTAAPNASVAAKKHKTESK